MFDFSILPLWVNVILFILTTSVVWRTGNRLTVYADIISDRTGISKALMGFIFLAVITQLPEIVTNSTAAIKGNALLVVNSMFGGIVMQIAVLAVADFSAYHQTLTHYAYRSANQLQGVMLILLLAFLLAVIELGDISLGWQVGASTLFFALLYIVSITLLWYYEKDRQWEAVHIPEEKKRDTTRKMKEEHKSLSLTSLKLRSLSAAAIILVSGIILVHLAERIATQSGLGSSFIGATLLATSTSLPELSTAIAAVRLGVPSMAFSDIFGSNLIMVLLLFPSDILYREGLLLDAADTSAILALIAGIILTAVYLLGLYIRSPRKFIGAGVDSWIVLLLYSMTLFAFYHVR